MHVLCTTIENVSVDSLYNTTINNFKKTFSSFFFIKMCECEIHRIYSLMVYSISPIYTSLSLEPDIIMGSFGWKSTSFTEPLCPGNLYRIRREVVSHKYTNLSAEPADTCNTITVSKYDNQGSDVQDL